MINPVQGSKKPKTMQTQKGTDMKPGDQLQATAQEVEDDAKLEAMVESTTWKQATTRNGNQVLMNVDSGDCRWQKPDAEEDEAIKDRNSKILKASRVLEAGKVEAAAKLAQAIGVKIEELPDMVKQIEKAERSRAERKTIMRAELLKKTSVAK